ncbi:hypothetical protein ACHWQZ_G005431 [Mnemiopsis leidyi]
MHRGYQNITPANNKVLKKLWDDTRYNQHRTNILFAEGRIDNAAPKTYMHLHLKLKKLQMEEERLATVERDNRILLHKMSNVMRTKGTVDNHIDNKYIHKSLNKIKRQRELEKIAWENKAIHKRIAAQGTRYCRDVWLDEWRVNERYMANICTFPQFWYDRMAEQDKPFFKELKQEACLRVGQANRQFQKDMKFHKMQQHKHEQQRSREKKIRREKAAREKRVALELDFIKKLKGLSLNKFNNLYGSQKPGKNFSAGRLPPIQNEAS